MASKVIIAGGTGFIGNFLTEFLSSRGYDVSILSRRPSGKVKTVVWDGKNTGAWTDALNGAKAVINLSGRSINCRPTAGNKREIMSSRTEPARVVGQAISSLTSPPEVWINASAVGFYGDTGNKPATETSAPGSDFIARVCVEWEKELFTASASVRKVALRIGMVLHRNGGALPELLKFARLGLGGAAGSGRQYVAWIHLYDLAAAIDFIIQSGNISGPVNAVSPDNPVNAAFMKSIRKAAGISFGLPQPSFMLIPGAWLIGTNPDLVLNSSRVVPSVLQEKGFRYSHPDLDSALNS